MSNEGTAGLAERWERHRVEHPHAHARDAARSLGVSEVELVGTGCGRGATRLGARFQQLIEALPSLGEVKTMTRNETAVIERWGCFERVEIEGAMGQVVGDEIDLRLFMRRWSRGFAVESAGPKGARRSLQFFDAQGDSIHKIFLEDPARNDAFDALVREHAAEDQAPGERVAAAPTTVPERPDAEIDREGLRRAWDAMTDTHEFHRLLGTYGVTRTQALRLAGRERAREVAADRALADVLTQAAASTLPVMVFVGNRGIIQIHTGIVERVGPRDGWFNVLDRRVNLHVRERDIAAAWVVQKPTRDGIVTSVELYDRALENVLLMFGRRKPGMQEAPAWRALVASLPESSA
jgi:putative hemin transport protein